MILERLKDIKRGQKVYIVPSDSRHEPQYAEVVSVGPKKITLKDISPDLRVYDTSTGTSLNWCGWSLYLSKEQYEEHLEIEDLKQRVTLYFQHMVKQCKDVDKLRRLEKRYKKYSDDWPF